MLIVTQYKPLKKVKKRDKKQVFYLKECYRNISKVAFNAKAEPLGDGENEADPDAEIQDPTQRRVDPSKQIN